MAGTTVVEYEADTDLRDTEQIPLQETGGIEAFLHREVLPYAKDAWYQPDSVRIGYEISFTRYFYKPKPMRTLTEIRADILALEQESKGLLREIVGQQSVHGCYNTDSVRRHLRNRRLRRRRVQPPIAHVDGSFHPR